jgi:hypothetical protein
MSYKTCVTLVFRWKILRTRTFDFEDSYYGISVGPQLFIANMDLPVRFARIAPLNMPDPNSFFTPWPHGYTDYPDQSAKQKDQSLSFGSSRNRSDATCRIRSMSRIAQCSKARNSIILIGANVISGSSDA